MSAFSDSGELFTIRNQFFTSQHHKVASYSLDTFSLENQLKVLEYQIRSKVALSEDASELIDKGKLLFPESTDVFDVLQAWNDLQTFGTDESTYFDDVSEAGFELQAVLTTLYLVKFKKDVGLAVQFLLKYVDSGKAELNELEPYLILVQLYLVQENFTEAFKIYKSFQGLPHHVRDNIIYQVLESWILSIKGESENISNAYYFYDEMLSGDFDDDPQGKFRLLNILLVMTIQMKHYPEAKELMNLIKALNYQGNEKDDFLANQITYDYLTNGGAEVDTLMKDLVGTNPDHQLLTDIKEKNNKFDEIVAKHEAAL